MNKIQSIRDSLDTHSKYSAPPGNAPNFSAFEPLSTSDVTKTIFAMKPKSCEIDPIPTKLLEEILISVIEPKTKVVNTSLQHGIFSKNWKTSVIRPLLKKIGLELIPSNYKPVSNLTFLSKVVKKTAVNQLVASLTITTLCQTNSQCIEPYVTAMVTTDLSAAFNMVDHDILLNTLHCKFGISDNAIELVNSYLRPRFCKVNIKNSYSLAIQLYFSTPQGSVTGLVLYLAYASMLEEVSIYTMELKISKGYMLIWFCRWPCSQERIYSIKKEFTPTKEGDEYSVYIFTRSMPYQYKGMDWQQ